MHKAFFLLVGVIAFAVAQGQATDKTIQWSLQQAIDYAYQHQKDMVNAQLDADISDAAVKEVIGIGLPQISASFDLKDYEKIPTTTFPDFVTPAVYEVLFKEGKLPRRDLGPVEQFPIQFGTRWNANAGINASQLVFNPAYLIGVRGSKELRELSKKNIQRTKIETNVAVSKAYYNVLVTGERLKLLDANAVRLKKLKDNTQAMFDNGFVEKIDLDRVTLAYNNMVTEQQKSARLAMLGNYLLKFQTGMDLNADLALTDSLNYSGLKDISISTEKPDVTKRVEYSILQSQRHLQELNLKRYKVAYYPTLTAYGSYSETALRDKFDIFETDKTWYPTAIIGATLSLNLFDGTQRERRIRQANLNLRKIENELSNTENAMTLEALNARTSLQNALVSYKTQEENLDLANRVVSVTRAKYEQGVGSNIEVIEAETALREAQTNYYSALYDALVAKLDVDKAIGNIK